MVSITITGSTEAGQNLSLICTVTIEAELVARPNIRWVKVVGGSMTLPDTIIETTPTVTVLTLPFTPLTFSHRGVYQCVVDLNISSVFSFSATEEYNITVQCEYPLLMNSIWYTVLLYCISYAVPLPVVSVQPVGGSIMVTGTARNLTCTITLTNVDDIIVMVDFTWSRGGESLPSLTRFSTFQSVNQSKFTSTLIFNPLDNNTDSGEHLCVVVMDSLPPDTFISPITANNTLTITVECESPSSALLHLCMCVSVCVCACPCSSSPSSLCNDHHYWHDVPRVLPHLYM